MSDKKIGIPEWRGLGVSAALHNEVVQNYSDKVAELETALASERAKRVEAEALAESRIDRVAMPQDSWARLAGATQVIQKQLLAAEATIAQVQEWRKDWLGSKSMAGASLDAILANADTSALARHDAEVGAKALEDAAGQFTVELLGGVVDALRARAAELRAQADE